MANENIDTKVGVLESVVSKLDTSIEKISQVSTDIGKLLAVHSERIDQLERSTDRRINDTREILAKLESVEECLEKKIENSVSATQQAQSEENKKFDKRIETLETWRWVIVGGSLVLWYIVTNLDKIEHYIKT